MATWDFGGGCPCGVSKVCDCKLADAAFNGLAGSNWSKEKKVAKNYAEDFGFSFVSEQDHLEQINSQATNKAIQIKDLIMPLLNNLMANPEKEMIKWPNRKPKIEAMIKKIDEIIQ